MHLRTMQHSAGCCGEVDHGCARHQASVPDAVLPQVGQVGQVQVGNKDAAGSRCLRHCLCDGVVRPGRWPEPAAMIRRRVCYTITSCECMRVDR